MTTNHRHPLASLRNGALIAHAMLASLFGMSLLIAATALSGGFPVGDGGHKIILGVAVATAIACIVGWRVAMRSWRRRLTAPVLLLLLQDDHAVPLYRLLLIPSLALIAIGIACSAPGRPSTLLMSGAMFTFLGASLEWFRRHARRHARVLFTLYADGALDAAGAARIDATRAADPAFDAAVRAFQQLNEAVAALGRTAPS